MSLPRPRWFEVQSTGNTVPFTPERRPLGAHFGARPCPSDWSTVWVYRSRRILKPQKVGVRRTSTFLGFCAEHDSQLFGPLETQSPLPSPQTAVLLSIRSAALEIFRKEQMIALFEAASVARRHDAARYGILKGAALAREEGIARLRDYFSWHHKGRVPSNFVFRLAVLPERINFAATGSFEPEYSLDGTRLFVGEMLKTKWNPVDYFMGVIRGQTYVYWGVRQKYAKHKSRQFVESLPAFTEQGYLSLCLTIALAHTENVFVRHSWFENLQPEDNEKIKILHRLFAGEVAIIPEHYYRNLIGQH